MNKNLYALAALAVVSTAVWASKYKVMKVESNNGAAAIEYKIGNVEEMRIGKGSVDIKSKAGAEREVIDDVKSITFGHRYDDVQAMPPTHAGNYLDEYGPLKSYVNRQATETNPDFKMCIAVEQFQLTNASTLKLVAENFDEITLGNEMKYASVVNSKGEMNFTTVKKMIDIAKKNGFTIYGHTLAWHSQQNIQYLSSLIADKEDPNAPTDPNSTRTQIAFTCSKAGSYAWDAQAGIKLDAPLQKGTKYTFEAEIKASAEADCGLWATWEASTNKNEWGGTNDVQYLEGKSITTGWKAFKWEFDAAYPVDKLSLVFGQFGGTIYFSDVKLTKQGSDANLIKKGDLSDGTATNWTNSGNAGTPKVSVVTGDRLAETKVQYVDNGTAEGTDMKNFYSTEKDRPVQECKLSADGKGHNGGKAFMITSIDNPKYSWDTQFFIKMNKPVSEGKELKVTFWYRADKAAQSESQTQKDPGGYIHYDGGLAVNFTTEWQKFEKTIKISSEQAGGGSMQTFAFNLNASKEANVYYFDDITIETTDKAGMIAMPKEEKAAAIAGAMDRWIKGMMEATDGFVTTWDVVNEAIGGGGDDGEGNYALQHANNVDDNGVGGSDFFWQDVLGDVEYVRTAVGSARKHFKGNPDKLKLFINDYNLESFWDGNKKLKSLINWIKKWEADGVTKIDGIGTQMHISYSMNPNDQKNREEHVVNMFKLMAASGKLVKITELDMGLVDASGNTVKTANVTAEQHKLMADYYKFIITKYFEIVPKEQQYGITLWCLTDAPANSGWRGGEPVGIYTLGTNNQPGERKEAYAGVADGLYEATK